MVWVLVAGCAGMGKARVSDKALANASAADRQQIQAQQHRVDVAESNVAAARAGLDDALKFQDVAGRNQKAAKTSLQAARSGLALGRDARAGGVIRAAASNETAARRQLAEARAMDSYATQLTKLRQARLDEAQAEAAVARADLESTRLAIAERHGESPKKAGKIHLQQERAGERLAEARLRVQAQAGQTQALRNLWMEQRQAAQRASAAPPIEAPPAPRELPLPPSR
jgi:hypothetical protein